MITKLRSQLLLSPCIVLLLNSFNYLTAQITASGLYLLYGTSLTSKSVVASSLTSLLQQLSATKTLKQRFPISKIMSKTNKNAPNPSEILGDNYRVIKKIGNGSFGDIYLGEDMKTQEKVAIKLESTQARRPQLRRESQIYGELQGHPGIPKLYTYLVESNFYVMVIELLGPGIGTLFNKCDHQLTLKTVLQLADQMITLLELLHSKNYIHRDIKPDNFLLGIEKNCHQVYLIDFGLSKLYVDPQTGEHIQFLDGKNLTGTARYTSINTHLGIEQSRRDDLETLGHVLLYFLRGTLPWQGYRSKNKKERYNLIRDKKIDTTIEELCHGFPVEFAQYITYTRSLAFEEDPDYEYLRRLFRDLYLRIGYTYDNIYDWNLLNVYAPSGVYDRRTPESFDSFDFLDDI